MQNTDPRTAIEQRITALSENLAEIRRTMEQMIADNRRLREVVRLAESELRKRRDQVEQLEQELHKIQNTRLEARARVEHAMEKLDEIMAQQGEQP